MKYFITGGAGFIGSNLIDAFIAKGAICSFLAIFPREKRKKLLGWTPQENLEDAIKKTHRFGIKNHAHPCH